MATVSIVVLVLSSLIAAYYLAVTVSAAITNKREIYNKWFRQIELPKLKADILDLFHKLDKNQHEHIPNVEDVINKGIFSLIKIIFTAPLSSKIFFRVWKKHIWRVLGAFSKIVLFPFSKKIISIATEFAANARLVILDISFGTSMPSSDLSSVFSVLEGFRVEEFNRLYKDDIKEIKTNISRRALVKSLFDTLNPDSKVNDIIFNYDSGNGLYSSYGFGDVTAKFCKVLIEKGCADKIKYLENGFKLVVYKKIVRDIISKSTLDERIKKIKEIEAVMLSRDGENIALSPDSEFKTNIISYLFSSPGIDNMYLVQNISTDESPVNVVLATDRALAIEKSKLLLLMMDGKQKKQLFKYMVGTDSYIKFKQNLTRALDLFPVKKYKILIKYGLDPNIDSKQAKECIEAISCLINAKNKFNYFKQIEKLEGTADTLFTDETMDNIKNILNIFKTGSFLPDDMADEYSRCNSTIRKMKHH